MTSIKVKFHPSSIIQKEGTLHDQIIHHREVRNLRTGYKLFPSEWNTALKRINVLAGKNEERRFYLTALKKHIDVNLFKIKECINRLKQENKPYMVLTASWNFTLLMKEVVLFFCVEKNCLLN